MLLPLAALLAALFVLPPPSGVVVLAAVVVWELAEKGYWLAYSRRLPVLTGRESLLGQPVTALSSCRPDGRVRLLGESWSAHCREGAEPGDRLVVEDVDLITLVVGKQAPERVAPSGGSRRRRDSAGWSLARRGLPSARNCRT
jgi:membrane protein implicated in regulation of membrane protease activity